jgi:N-methylhydantoinase B
MTNTANSPVELIEREYPLTVLDYSLVDGSGGAGEFAGGLGLRRTIIVNADSVLTVHLDRTRHKPWGVMGGSPARGSRITISDADGERQLAGKSTSRVGAGTTITMETAGGGGWGTAESRPHSP